VTPITLVGRSAEGVEREGPRAMQEPGVARTGSAVLVDVPHEITTFDLPVEQGKILEFARSIGEEDPVYRDADAARARGYEGIPAPLTFSVVSAHFADASRTGGSYLTDVLGMDMGRVVQGAHEWEYHAPVIAGMTLHGTMSLISDERKTGRRGGGMRIVVREVVYRNDAGEKVLSERLTAIETEQTVGA
jgi:N-terminal half of MaoC dehydratase